MQQSLDPGVLGLQNGPSHAKPLSPKDTNSQPARGAAPKKALKPGAASSGASSSANQGIADDDDAGLQVQSTCTSSMIMHMHSCWEQEALCPISANQQGHT